METDAILGCVVIAVAIGLMIGLVWWSRRTINWIARNGYGSARQILRDLRSGG